MAPENARWDWDREEGSRRRRRCRRETSLSRLVERTEMDEARRLEAGFVATTGDFGVG